MLDQLIGALERPGLGHRDPRELIPLLAEGAQLAEDDQRDRISDALEKQLEHPWPSVRMAAISALASLGLPQAELAIMRAGRDSNRDVAEAAHFASAGMLD